MTSLSNVLVDVRHDHAPDLYSLPILGVDDGEGRVLGLKAHAAATRVQALASEFAIDHGDHDVPVLWPDGFVHQHDGAIQDARVAHRVASDTHEKGGLWMAHKLAHELYALDLVVLCRRGEACRHTCARGVQPDWFASQLDGFQERLVWSEHWRKILLLCTV